MHFQPSAKFVLWMFGSSVLALVLAFVFAALSISGVQSMNAAIICLWIAFGIYATALVATAVVYCPDKSGTRSSLATLCLIVLLALGFWGRSTLDEWLKKQKALQLASATLSPPPLPKPPSAPRDWKQTKHERSRVDIDIKQGGNGSTANPGVNTGTIKQGLCGVVQNGGSGNVASPNCAPLDRRLTDQQKDTIAASAQSLCISSPSISVTASNANQEAQLYAEDIISALNRKEAGCRADLALPIPGLKPDVMGVNFAIRGRPGLNESEARLYEGLKSAGITVGIHPMASDFFPQETFVIVIGARETSPKQP